MLTSSILLMLRSHFGLSQETRNLVMSVGVDTLQAYGIPYVPLNTSLRPAVGALVAPNQVGSGGTTSSMCVKRWCR